MTTHAHHPPTPPPKDAKQIPNLALLYPHLSPPERRHFHACKLIHEFLQARTPRPSEARIEARFQLYIRMLEAFDAAAAQVAPGNVYHVLRRHGRAGKWECVGRGGWKSVREANAVAEEVAGDGEGAEREEGWKFFEVEGRRGGVMEVLVMRCGAVRRDSCWDGSD